MGGMAGDGSANKHFYAYNPRSNAWQRKKDFPGTPRFYPFMVNMNKKGYVMGGFIRGAHFNDFYAYDPSTDSWNSLPYFGGVPRVSPAGFVIGNTIFVGNGRNNGIHFQDWWIYQNQTNTWKQIINYPEDFSYGTIGFSIGNKGYCGLGQSSKVGLRYSNSLFSFTDTGLVNSDPIPELESYHVFGTRDIVFKNVSETVKYSLIDATGRYVIKNKIITEDKIETMPIISSAIYNVSIEHRGRRFSYKLFYPPDITL
jgi:N-acetylneuraminic acid mutarotase